MMMVGISFKDWILMQSTATIPSPMTSSMMINSVITVNLLRHLPKHTVKVHVEAEKNLNPRSINVQTLRTMN